MNTNDELKASMQKFVESTNDFIQVTSKLDETNQMLESKLAEITANTASDDVDVIATLNAKIDDLEHEIVHLKTTNDALESDYQAVETTNVALKDEQKHYKMLLDRSTKTLDTVKQEATGLRKQNAEYTEMINVLRKKLEG